MLVLGLILFVMCKRFLLRLDNFKKEQKAFSQVLGENPGLFISFYYFCNSFKNGLLPLFKIHSFDDTPLCINITSVPTELFKNNFLELNMVNLLRGE